MLDPSAPAAGARPADRSRAAQSMRNRQQHASPNVTNALAWDTSAADKFDSRRWDCTVRHDGSANPVSQLDRVTGEAQPQMSYSELNKSMQIPTVSRREPKGSLRYMFPGATGQQPPPPEEKTPPALKQVHGYNIIKNSSGDKDADSTFAAKEREQWKRRNTQALAAVPVNQRDRGYNVVSGVEYDTERAAREQKAERAALDRRYHLVRQMAEEEEARRNQPVRQGKRLGLAPQWVN